MATPAKSWVAVPEDCDFTLQNLPYGVFSTKGQGKRCGVAIGTQVLDLAAAMPLLAGVPGLDGSCFNRPSLNAFMAKDSSVWRATRSRITDLLQEGGSGDLRNDPSLLEKALIPQASVEMHLPAVIGDYTDFFSSRDHAENCGKILRGIGGLNPNWLRLPVCYHGRSSSVFLSGAPVVRPHGQLHADKADPTKGSVFGTCQELDFELEMAFFVGGPPTAPGSTITMQQAEERIFGLVVMNDWSARDIQKWEMAPLGPFGAKNFATSISAWVVPYEALLPFRTPTSAGTQTDPEPLPYLQDPNYDAFDVQLQVAIQGKGMAAPGVVCKSNMKNLYWNIRQQLVHHAVTGCAMRPGDLLGTGTISGSAPDSLGCMLEASWKHGGAVPLGDSGETRTFLQDGDTVTMSGRCEGPNGLRVGFGSVHGTVLAAGSTVPSAFSPPEASDPSEPGVALRFEGLKLYGFWRSSSCWRVRLALAAKGLQYENVAVDLARGEQAQLSAVNPMMQVPSLEMVDIQEGGKTIFLSQSLPIIEFLHETYGSSGLPLMPSDPVMRARARQIAEIVNSNIQPLQGTKFLNQLKQESNGAIDPSVWGERAIRTGLEAVEKLAVSFGASRQAFLTGCGHVTVAEIFVVPQLHNARRAGVEVEKLFPTLVEVERACLAMPWVQSTHPDRQPDAPSA